ncbi:glycosyltransferase, MGT family [Streptomyces sp. 2224.1]|uniref:nucleotide disphospho-sugar-binding domain-containing protein n=1 Tax=unclassified Streptomyces TaxID=2593676 RepID=UPI0008992129|nr:MULTISPECIES: nucleotide disphospho-sugar-binding domain-containing protein [unclassified Streptomyces]SED69270.1 glycosyltransferase, MGT family [Streptomyces sp. 2112.3]SED93279.1 glycosyltransferase, MGT family [Streptomyces sp. 2224.1]
MRVLFVVPPLAGHVNPTIAVAAELTARGHQVAWTGPAAALATLLPADYLVYPAGDRSGGDGIDVLHGRWRDLRGIAALRFLWADVLLPLARAMLPGVHAAVGAFAPDVLVADQQALAGPLVARRHGLPWATSATTTAEFTRPFAGVPKVGEWVAQRIAALLAECGAPSGWDPRFSPHLVLVFSTPALLGDGGPAGDEAGGPPVAAAHSSAPAAGHASAAPRPAGRRYPSHYAFVGPAFGSRPFHGDFPWHRLDPQRARVLVSLGTLNREAGARFYPAVLRAADALADRAQLILAAPADLAGNVPHHVLHQEYVPQLALLPHLDAVLCHGGHNTVCEALAYGLPLVVAPVRDDQPIVAGQVTGAGAGVRVRFGRARADELHQALAAVLDDPAHRRAARRIQASFAEAGGARTAADRLEKLRAGAVAGPGTAPTEPEAGTEPEAWSGPAAGTAAEPQPETENEKGP